MNNIHDTNSTNSATLQYLSLTTTTPSTKPWSWHHAASRPPSLSLFNTMPSIYRSPRSATPSSPPPSLSLTLCSLSSRSPRSATPPPPPSSATTPATTSSPGWCPRTLTRPRPWWTWWRPCAGTMCPPWRPKATTERAALTPSSRSPGKTVSHIGVMTLCREGKECEGVGVCAVWVGMWWFRINHDGMSPDGTLLNDAGVVIRSRFYIHLGHLADALSKATYNKYICQERETTIYSCRYSEDIHNAIAKHFLSQVNPFL